MMERQMRMGYGTSGGGTAKQLGIMAGGFGLFLQWRPLLIMLVSLIILMSLPAAIYALDLEVPGQYGARDTKVLVFNNQPGPSGRQDDGTSDAIVMWTHDRGVGLWYYDIYRYQRGSDRSFGTGAIGTCKVYVSPSTGAVTVTGEPGQCWRDSKFNYIVFRDNGLANYEEYYYLVAVRSEPPGQSVGSIMANINKYVVAPAFPPTQTRHGNFSEYTNACSACHGLHSSKHKKLLKAPTVTDLCGTCHDGTGSKYDEVRGRVRTGDSWGKSAFAAAGPFGDRLKEQSGVITTSTHNVLRSTNGLELDGSNALAGSARVWQAPGSGWLNELRSPGDVPLDLGISNDWGSQLVCSSCHEPHNRSKNYRLLRGVINDRTYIVVRGVSEVNPAFNETLLDRGEWGAGDINNPILRRAMYSRFLAGGNSVLTYKDPVVEDKGFACANESCTALAPDSGDLDGDGNTVEDKAKAYCELANEQQNTPNYMTDSGSPTGVRCLVERNLGGVTTFCTACHRGFMWAEAWIGRVGDATGSVSDYINSNHMTFGDTPGHYSRKMTVTNRLEAEGGGPGLTYAGVWGQNACGGCSGGYEYVSFYQNDYVELAFTGTQVDVLASSGPDRGIIDVFIDGVFADRVNLYTSQRIDQQLIFSWAGTDGSHVLKLVNTGERDLASSDTIVGIDAFLLTQESFSYTSSSAGDMPGEHKHPVSLPASRAYREGRLAEGVLASDGDVCSLRKALTDPRCANVGQGRLVDPVVPLEGIAKGKWQYTGALSGNGYAQNKVVCLTCHVAHGSGAERIEVAYANDDLNDAKVYTCVNYNGDGICGNSPGESLGPALSVKRDQVTGYLWNRMGDGQRDEDRLGYVCVNSDGDPECGNSPGERYVARQDGTADSQFNSKAWDFTEPVFDATGKKLERWETKPAGLPEDQPYWTQLGVSSALARFNPFASVCYRCHSATSNGAVVP